MISTLIHDAKSYGYDGINLDFENIKAEDVQDYLQFMRELSVACQTANIVLSADNYKPQSYNAYYNLKEQSSFADYIIIMGYDEHYAGSDAGSVASLPFVESGIADASAMVPNTQLINAIPFYTRIWTISASGTTSKAVGMQGAVDEMNANGATATWDAVEGQNYSAYQKDGAQVEIWLEDEKSIEQKMNVISKYQLAGVAEWKLGFETPAIWNVISRGLNY
jgi:spore germination protein YaaH